MGVDKLPVVLQPVRLHQNGEVHSIQENITICAGTLSQKLGFVARYAAIAVSN